jgi:hypothetical protein
MTVYVDAIRSFTPRDPATRRAGTRWCHMFSDQVDTQELHQLAQRIGLKSEWFQNAPNKLPHYDLTPRRRAMALEFGAVHATRAVVVAAIRAHRPIKPGHRMHARNSGLPLIPGDWSKRLGAADGAWFSDCGRYRTLLWRTFAGRESVREPMVFGMLNPSTADELKLDPTIRRCVGFAQREGAGGVVVVNLSPLRATDPEDLYAAHARGEDVFLAAANEHAWRVAAQLGGGRIVLAWGARYRPWMAPARELALRLAGQGAMCLGLSKEGQPRHPLRLESSTPLVPFQEVKS